MATPNPRIADARIAAQATVVDSLSELERMLAAGVPVQALLAAQSRRIGR